MVSRPLSNLYDLMPLSVEEAPAPAAAPPSTLDLVIAKSVADYVQFLQELRPDSLRRLDDLAAPTLYFADPFHSLRGTEAVKGFYRKMFETLDRPRFEIRSHAINGRLVFLRWEFSCRPKTGFKLMRRKVEPKPATVSGVAELRFDDAGRLTDHVNFWDAGQQVYERLPKIGPTLTKLRERFAATAFPLT